MSFMSKVKGLGLLVIGAAGGAAASHFFDPVHGRTRRAKAADQLGAAARSGLREAERQVDYTTGRVKGAAIEAAKTFEPERELDERTLKHKVESEVLGHVDVASGEVVVTARDGIVELRGQVSSQNQIDEIVRRTRDLAGVRGVENLLHLPGQPAPNTAAAAAASGDTAEGVETSDTTVG